jgi:hypothetical protein
MLKPQERHFLIKQTLIKVHIHLIFGKNFYDEILVLDRLKIKAYIKKEQK